MARGGAVLHTRFILSALLGFSTALPQGEPIIKPQGSSIPTSWFHTNTDPPALGTIPNFAAPGETITSNCLNGFLGEGPAQTYSACFFNQISQAFPTTHASFSAHPIANETTAAVNSSGVAVTIPPQCSQYCYISADEVQVIYWPTPYATPTVESNATGTSNISATITPAPPNPSTIVSDGFTYVSPSVYVVYSGLVGRNDIFGPIGSTYDNLTLGYDPSVLSTVEYCNTCGLTQSMNFQDFNKPPRWSVISEQYGCEFFGHSYSTRFLPKSHPPEDFVTDYNELSEWIRFSTAGEAQSWELKPIIDIPPGLTNLDPAWKSCSRWTGIWDPPRPLVSISDLAPISMPAQPAVMPKPAVTPAAPVTHTPVPAMVPASPEQPAGQTPAPQTMTGGGPSDPSDPGSGSGHPIVQGPADPTHKNEGGPTPAGDSQSGNGNVNSEGGSPGEGASHSGDPGSNVGDPSGGDSNDSGSSGSVPSGGSGSPFNSPVQDPPNQDPPNHNPPNHDPPNQDPPNPDPPNPDPPNPDPPNPDPPNPDPPNPDPPNPDPPNPDPPTQNPPTQDPPRQDPPAPAKVSVPFALVTPKQTPQTPPLTVAGLPAFLDNSGNIAIGSSTLTPGGPAMTAAPGTTISVLPSKGGVIVNGKTITVPKSANPPAKPVVGIVAAGKTWTPAGSSAVAADGQTLSIGDSGAKIGGTPVMLHSDGFVAGPSTIALPVNNRKPVAWTAAGQTFTKLDDGTIVAGGKTLASDSSPQVIGEQTMSLGSGVIFADGSSIIAVPVFNQALPTDIPGGAGPQIIAPGLTLQNVGKSEVLVNGMTITSGAAPVTAPDGKPFSWGEGGIVVGGSTIPLPTAASPAAVAATFVAAGETFTPIAGGNVVVQGVMVSSGDARQTIDGHIVSLGKSGLVVDQSTFAIPLGPDASATKTFIAGGQTFTSLSPTALAVNGQTILSAAPALIIDGQRISLGNAGLIVGSSTVALPTPVAGYDNPSDFSAAGETITALAPGTVVIDGMTVTSGAPAYTLHDGQTVSIGAAGLVIGSSTIAIPALASAPISAFATATFVAGDQTFTRVGSTLLVDGTATITSGASGPKTIDGHTISWGASGIIINGSSTFAIPTLLPSSVEATTSLSDGESIGSLILGGFGPASSITNAPTSATASNAGKGSPPSGSASAAIPSGNGELKPNAAAATVGRLNGYFGLWLWVTVCTALWY